MSDFSRRAFMTAGAAALTGAALGPVRASAKTLQFLQIATGMPSGCYFPMGGLIAAAISRPLGSRPCNLGGSCGVDGLVAVGLSSPGSLENISAIEGGERESAFVQADLAAWAYRGDGPLSHLWPHESLRVVASLYPELMHLVVRRDSGLTKVSDLKGKRVSVGEEGSGTRLDALLVLEAYGLGEDDLEMNAWSVGEAADLLREGYIDAFFFVAGTPTKALTELSDESLITLIPIDGPEAEAVMKKNPLMRPSRIEAHHYYNVPSTKTLSVTAQWLVAAHLPNDQVYEMARTLWLDPVQKYLRQGHPLGANVLLREALDDVEGPPLHEGAKRFYQENGFLSWVSTG